ncbi:hypothetical protein K2Z84_31990 [Candidatus Binatia bacterium]|nr:hypothetical protein [Candidatus Binatia bacterium]
MMNNVDIRTVIADRLEHQAQWRSEKALEYPDDYRNVRAANAMISTAKFIRALPDDDARLVFLGAVLDENTGGSSADYLERLLGPLKSNPTAWHEFMADEREMWARIGFDDQGSPVEHLDTIVAFYPGVIDCDEQATGSRG